MIKYLLQRAFSKWIDQWNATVVKISFEDSVYYFYRNTSTRNIPTTSNFRPSDCVEITKSRNGRIVLLKWLWNKNITSVTVRIFSCWNAKYCFQIMRASKYLQLSKISWLYIYEHRIYFVDDTRFCFFIKSIYSEKGREYMLESLNKILHNSVSLLSWRIKIPPMHGFFHEHVGAHVRATQWFVFSGCVIGSKFKL